MSAYRGPVQNGKPLPAPHRDIRIVAREYKWGFIIEYVAPSLSALVAAGCITQAMAASLSREARGKRRTDDRGHRYRRVNKPSRTFPNRVLFERWIDEEDREFALSLPGVAENLTRGDSQKRSATVRQAVVKPGHRRRLSWTSEGDVIYPDWPILRAATAAWREARA